ncbi:pyridoxamine 5'-phosphate oxidase family protein [Micromonospora vinacea]|uniref:FMN-binding regulatory protein PaiB n=1 Tax=Micromonospora vinacea TaxID=709878 RepID=A0ABS0KBB8_9ACTN|nr:pyridoxamine 5'-phosphate oxidase family protein [Micromonospora vinacea]MBG6105934.1 putative FMN-binding regulatory protein PaiB [Micromonospora vinacea]WSZ77918.1 pyridoxamine 5'-phosphate oxidase family protein [Micromonospora sp. NBC_00860]WTA65650.1 pyridoxamine 5'-phosphate oxidase family protein [Micromonospora sp. NBC_00855]
MLTYATSQKVANLRRDPRVVCLAEDGDDYSKLRAVQLTGTMELITDPLWIADVVMRLRMKYERIPVDDPAAATRAALDGVAKQIGLRVRVDRVVSWDHRKLRR